MSTRRILTRSIAVLAAAAVASGLAPTTSRAIVGVTEPVAAPPASTSPYFASARAAQARAMASQARGRTVYSDANLARTYFNLFGWTSVTGRVYLQRVLDQQHTDGGWGLGHAWDAFGDGTTNPADATYTVTTADHVGPLLIQGHKAGLVPSETLTKAVRSVMDTPTATMGAGRKCMSYSRSAHDQVTPTNTRCINNVNAAAGWFLDEAASAGIVLTGQQELARQLLDHDASQRRKDHMWTYARHTTRTQDRDHGALNAVAHRESTGREAFGHRSVRATMYTKQTVHPATGLPDPTDHLAVLRLTAYMPSLCDRNRSAAGAMIAATDALAARGDARNATIRYSQVALYSSILATSCTAD